jgi:hypothetical protein
VYSCDEPSKKKISRFNFFFLDSLVLKKKRNTHHAFQTFSVWPQEHSAQQPQEPQTLCQEACCPASFWRAQGEAPQEKVWHSSQEVWHHSSQEALEEVWHHSSEEALQESLQEVKIFFNAKMKSQHFLLIT